MGSKHVSYTAILKPTAEKSLDKLPRPARVRILDAIQTLQRDPRPAGCVKLSGSEELWRIRVGDYRVVYEIQDRQLRILVVRVAHRKDVYRKGN